MKETVDASSTENMMQNLGVEYVDTATLDEKGYPNKYREPKDVLDKYMQEKIYVPKHLNNKTNVANEEKKMQERRKVLGLEKNLNENEKKAREIVKRCGLALAESMGARPHETLAGCLLLEGGDVSSLPAFREGLFYVQDPAARLAVQAAEPRPGMKVLDVCAAPGGKSFAAAIAMENRGRVDARDVSGPKLNLVMDGAERLGLDIIQCREADVRDTEEGDYDLVLVDLPCSGLGVIRKKPDIRWRERVELDRLPELQLELLTAAARAVRPGGRLLYSTCTWRVRENGPVAEAFLRTRPDFEKTMERTFWPDLDGTDGFYLCRMERKNGI